MLNSLKFSTRKKLVCLKILSRTRDFTEASFTEDFYFKVPDFFERFIY